MDNQPQTAQPISDDQELTEVLAGVSKDSNDLNFEETPVLSPPEKTDEKSVVDSSQKPSDTDDTPNTDSNEDLDIIKKNALSELRPLIEKLDLAPEEKFDIYLLMLRNTDDKSLIAPAHVAAQSIADETKRAQALLDIIKEIDYLSSPHQAV